jgi:putative ABC transport system permease protein
MNVWVIAWRNVVRNRRRSLLSGGIVVFGFISFALAGGFMAQSFNGLRDSTLRSGLGHLQFAHPSTFDQSEDATLEHGLTNTDVIGAILAKDTAVAVVMPRIEFFGLVTAGARSVPFMGLGVDPVAEAQGSDIPASVGQGHWLIAGQREVVLGRGLAQHLNARVGDTLTLLATTPEGVLNAVDANVAGIADVMIKELSDRYLATTLSLAQELLNVSNIASKISVGLREPANEAESGKRLLAKLLPLSPGLMVKRWDELAVFYAQVKMLYIGIFGFMGAILMVVVFLAAINTTLMTVTERTREIGTLRAMGARTNSVVKNFVTEAILLGLAASGAGALLSIVISLALNATGIVLPPPPGSTHGFPIHIQFFPVSYVIATLAMTASLAVAAYFPARRAARASIVSSLAHV